MLGGEGNRVMHRMASLSKLPVHPDDRRQALVRGLMSSSVARDLEVRIPIEPQLLHRAHEVRYLLAGVNVTAHVKRPELQGVSLAEGRLG